MIISGRVVEKKDAKDGDVVLRASLSAAGRAALSGRHTNYGYSGYWRPFICVGGKLVRMYVDDFSPYRYETQNEKEEAFERVVAIISELSGKTYNLRKQMPKFKRDPAPTAV